MSYEASFPSLNKVIILDPAGAPLDRGAPVSRYITRITRVIFAFIVLYFLSVPASFAHKVNMFAYVEGSKVMMEGYFADGNKPVNCEVIVTNPDKKVLVKGLTDQDGKFSFDVPEITDLRIILNAGMGHRAEFVISRSELAGMSPLSTAGVIEAADSKSTATEPDSESGPEAAPEEISEITVNASEAAIRKAVADANIPLMRSIEELKEDANFSNIIGGIGFIFGIVGLLFYIKARKMLAATSSLPPAVK